MFFAGLVSVLAQPNKAAKERVLQDAIEALPAWCDGLWEFEELPMYEPPFLGRSSRDMPMVTWLFNYVHSIPGMELLRPREGEPPPLGPFRMPLGSGWVAFNSIDDCTPYKSDREPQ